MKNNWILTSIISGTVGGIIAFLYTNNWKISLVAAIIVLIIVLSYNPQKRYMKAFWVIISMFLILNKFFFEVIGSFSDTYFKVGSNEIGNSVSICLLILAGFCLILDYLERNGKLEGTFLSIRKNKVGDIKGNNNTIDQNNV